jgi:hypothetical protein
MTFRGVLREVVHDVVHLNFSTVRTFVGLLLRPGQVAREQIVDQSEAHVRPLSYAFWTSTAYLLVDKLTATPVSSFFDPFTNLQAFWPYLGMLALLPIAGLQRLLFRREDYTAAETYAYQLFAFGQIVVFETALLLGQRGLHLDVQPWWAYRIPELVYAAWAATGFYASRRLSVWLRGAAVYLAGAGFFTVMLLLYEWTHIFDWFLYQ